MPAEPASATERVGAPSPTFTTLIWYFVDLGVGGAEVAQTYQTRGNDTVDISAGSVPNGYTLTREHFYFTIIGGNEPPVALYGLNIASLYDAHYNGVTGGQVSTRSPEIGDSCLADPGSIWVCAQTNPYKEFIQRPYVVGNAFETSFNPNVRFGTAGIQQWGVLAA